MTDERKRGGWGVPILLLAMLYTMSIGPAWRAWHTGLLDVAPKSIDAFYMPLDRAVLNSLAYAMHSTLT